MSKFPIYLHVVTIYKYIYYFPPPLKLSLIRSNLTLPKAPVFNDWRGEVVLHVTPSSYRVYLSPCEVWVFKRPSGA